MKDGLMKPMEMSDPTKYGMMAKGIVWEVTNSPV